jgi:hypothetical protein
MRSVVGITAELPLLARVDASEPLTFRREREVVSRQGIEVVAAPRDQ